MIINTVYCGTPTMNEYTFRICWNVLKTFFFFLNIEIFCNIINVFTVTFDQFDAPLLNKNTNKTKQKTNKFEQ